MMNSPPIKRRTSNRWAPRDARSESTSASACSLCAISGSPVGPALVVSVSWAMSLLLDEDEAEGGRHAEGAEAQQFRRAVPDVLGLVVDILLVRHAVDEPLQLG